jgi:hypothetical protein
MPVNFNFISALAQQLERLADISSGKNTKFLAHDLSGTEGRAAFDK